MCTLLLPFHASREPLGVLDAWMWGREHKDKDGDRPGIKESVRWVEGYERLAEMASELSGTRLVYLADREADIMELMRRAGALGTPVDWLLRSQHNRTAVQRRQAVECRDAQRAFGRNTLRDGVPQGPARP